MPVIATLALTILETDRATLRDVVLLQKDRTTLCDGEVFL